MRKNPMEQEGGLPQTSPKPFIFVLMPFKSEFRDIYQLGIKGAAEAAGAYTERVDDQIFQEGIMERIYNQISKSDIVVADMTGQNPNVFYEVGYAHALNKIVLLITQEANDIPFDLQHRQHIVYGKSITELKNQLIPRIEWAIEEAKKRGKHNANTKISINIIGQEILESNSWDDLSFLTGSRYDAIASQKDPDNRYGLFWVTIHNIGVITTGDISHVYFFSDKNCFISPLSIDTSEINRYAYNVDDMVDNDITPSPILCAENDSKLSFQFRILGRILSIPPGESETFGIAVKISHKLLDKNEKSYHMLRIYLDDNPHDFCFSFAFKTYLSNRGYISPDSNKLSLVLVKLSVNHEKCETK
jgi:hypothetical protein